jgi:hypothetical protein
VGEATAKPPIDGRMMPYGWLSNAERRLKQLRKATPLKNTSCQTWVKPTSEKKRSSPALPRARITRSGYYCQAEIAKRIEIDAEAEAERIRRLRGAPMPFYAKEAEAKGCMKFYKTGRWV